MSEGDGRSRARRHPPPSAPAPPPSHLGESLGPGPGPPRTRPGESGEPSANVLFRRGSGGGGGGGGGGGPGGGRGGEAAISRRHFVLLLPGLACPSPSDTPAWYPHLQPLTRNLWPAPNYQRSWFHGTTPSSGPLSSHPQLRSWPLHPNLWVPFPAATLGWAAPADSRSLFSSILGHPPITQCLGSPFFTPLFASSHSHPGTLLLSYIFAFYVPQSLSAFSFFLFAFSSVSTPPFFSWVS